jgi:hypothetical protein
MGMLRVLRCAAMDGIMHFQEAVKRLWAIRFEFLSVMRFAKRSRAVLIDHFRWDIGC